MYDACRRFITKNASKNMINIQHTPVFDMHTIIVIDVCPILVHTPFRRWGMSKNKQANVKLDSLDCGS